MFPIRPASTRRTFIRMSTGLVAASVFSMRASSASAWRALVCPIPLAHLPFEKEPNCFDQASAYHTRGSVPTSAETMLAAVKTLYDDGWNAHNAEVVWDIVAPDHVYHDTITPGIGEGPQGYHDLMTFYFAAFSDLDFPVHDIVIGSNAVGVRWTADATQTGAVFGVPPTEKHLTVPAMAIHTFTEGKISATTVIYDTLGMLVQLGLAPSTGSNPSATPEALFSPSVASQATSQTSDEAASRASEFYNVVWNSQDPASVGDFVTPDFTYIDPAVPTLPPGPNSYSALVTSFLAGIPDLQIEIDNVVSSGSSVALHWIGTGTQTGEFMGIPPTGKSVSAEAISFLTFKGNLIATNWSVFDTLGILIQLEVIPPPGGASGGATGTPPLASPAS